MDFATAPSDPLAAALRLILRGLRAGVAAWGLEPVLALLLYRRIGEVAGRIERMLIRFRAGRLWRVTHRAAGRRSGARTGAVLPRRFGWLVKSCGHRAALFRSQLEAVLATPDMAELLAAAPQAGRVLRPLCRALALDFPMREDKPIKSVKIRRRTSRARLETLRIPLPRGVLTAARRAGFGKDR